MGPILVAKLGKTGGHIATMVIIALLIVSVTGIWSHNIRRNHDANVTAKTQRIDAAAKEDAALQRAADIAQIHDDERKRNDAIAHGEDSLPSAAGIRHICERLRRQGADTGRIAQCGGSGGGTKTTNH